MQQLGSSAGPLDIVTQFSADYRLQAGQVREALADVRSMIQRSSGAEAWHGLKLATVQHCMGDRRGAAQSLVECVAAVGGLAEREAGGQGAAGLTWATGRCNVLLYTCTVLYCSDLGHMQV